MVSSEIPSVFLSNLGLSIQFPEELFHIREVTVSTCDDCAIGKAICDSCSKVSVSKKICSILWLRLQQRKRTGTDMVVLR